jgi:membrane-bound lytic murein transglycosylase D
LVDERRDPVKSSYAAARYLRDLYNIFGDWNLVIAAYNCGPETINKAIRRSGGERDYWKIYPYLPKETRGYVPAFIAANYAMTYYCEHNICPMESKLPTKTDTVMVDRNLNFSQIADVCGFDINMLRALNPAYKRDVVPGATSPSPIRLPISDVALFIDNQDSIYAMTANTDKRMVVEVDNATVKKEQRTTNRKKQGTQRHKVRQRENLGSIAKKYGTTISKLKSLNGLRSSKIRAGQHIRVR